jgi:predicted DNA-binding transcriptional regulator YafY
VPGDYEKGEKEYRVIKLFTRLSETEVGLTTRQLADELEVNTRTVQRYVATLRDNAGIDIETKDGRWRIGERSRLPPLQLDHYQATLLLVAVRLLQQLRPEQDPALVGALAHLSRALAVPLVSEYLRRTLAAAERRKPAPERLGVERAVIDGFVQHREIEVRYVDAKGNETKRDLRPYFIEPAAESRHIYVFARDSVSREVRSFRLDRIRTARVLPTTFKVPDDFDIDDALGAAWSIWQGAGGDRVVLRFPEAVRQWVDETPWPARAQRSNINGGGIEVRLDVASEVEMRPWLMRWGSNVEVLEPPSLRAHMAETLAAAAALYASNPGKPGRKEPRWTRRSP